ncbi:ferric-dicitrate binding protein FerR, regulates iron transport through sigma-19 [Chitinophaga eiseniae]|uniref:Ferric-dicitrate binding protein FerR, regulates iron transport through sigma-19 n=1 Tax=Chitinophaga eiseniae TaxID=634771 RepID=A0A1T4U3V1_9BACT|nr:FecR domain-containing protein [Chitinophaga eiseniae]SKA47290.1 ferric-dicitrate binding protein FerR, regulates iron transport through sigma-19 [Chitinophaga eiseniae]
MPNDAFIQLITRKLAGVATPDEIRELDALLEQYPELKTRYHQLSRYFAEAPHREASNAELVLQRTLSKIKAAPLSPEKEKRKTFRWQWAAAAAVVSGLAAGVFLLFRPHPATSPLAGNSLQWRQQANPKGIKSFLTLADGTRIWLNAESELKYPRQFGDSREVYLEGEAFLEVADDVKRPFIVHLREGTVKVLGTAFNIRAYHNEPVQTAVVSGKVAFIPRYNDAKQTRDTILITPDVKVSYTSRTGTLVKDTTTSLDDKAWTEGRLVFRNNTLEEICASLERNFGKHVVFEADAPRQYRMTGAFRNNSLQDIMYYLSRSKPFHYTITDSTLVISE